MTMPFLGGLLAAWTLTHLTLAIFFLLAYFAGRRESQYFIFSLLCLAFSVMTLGVGVSYIEASASVRVLSDQIAHTGAILAAVLNVHFALCFVEVKRSKQILRLLYGTAAMFIALNWSGLWWRPESYRVVHGDVFGYPVEYFISDATAIGWSFYVVGLAEVGFGFWLLYSAYRQGRRETIGSLSGALLLVPTLVNDVLLTSGVIENSINLLPHAFLLYGLGVAGTLLFRYRVATAELEQMAESLRQRTEELHHSYAELREVQNELVMKKQLAAVGELAAAIAHEVRNPLAVIVNAVAGLRRSGIRDQDRSILLGIVDEEAARLNRLVTDLLRFARPVNIKRSPVSLVELANRSRSQAMDGHEIVVSMIDDPEVHTVWVDPSLFRLVFDNLVENACQAMRGGGRVQVSVDRGEIGDVPAVRIEIKDHGHGMDPSVRDRALDPFFTTRPSGTGLGLPIVHRIVEAHGGRIIIDSVEGQGTTVTLLVPSGAPPEQAEEMRSEKTP
jgi:signal transduction histidine kinase